MADKKIIKQDANFLYYDDKTKISIDEYRKQKGLKPLKKTVEKILDAKEIPSVEKSKN